MWVVLSEDGVEFYKKKTDRSPKGMIPLKGASFISPCQEFGKRSVSNSLVDLLSQFMKKTSVCTKINVRIKVYMWEKKRTTERNIVCTIQMVFKITTDKKQDHFFQASHVEERELWVKDIKRAISCLEGGKRFARKSTRRSIRLPSTVNLRCDLWILLGVEKLNLIHIHWPSSLALLILHFHRILSVSCTLCWETRKMEWKSWNWRKKTESSTTASLVLLFVMFFYQTFTDKEPSTLRPKVLNRLLVAGCSTVKSVLWKAKPKTHNLFMKIFLSSLIHWWMLKSKPFW